MPRYREGTRTLQAALKQLVEAQTGEEVDPGTPIRLGSSAYRALDIREKPGTVGFDAEIDRRLAELSSGDKTDETPAQQGGEPELQGDDDPFEAMVETEVGLQVEIDEGEQAGTAVIVIGGRRSSTPGVLAIDMTVDPNEEGAPDHPVEAEVRFGRGKTPGVLAEDLADALLAKGVHAEAVRDADDMATISLSAPDAAIETLDVVMKAKKSKKKGG